jgi:hypothetical protein
VPHHETEREHPSGDLERARADRITEDQDASDDRNKVGCDRRAWFDEVRRPIRAAVVLTQFSAAVILRSQV